MTNNSSGRPSAYAGSRIVLTTRHAKSAAVAPPFERILGASVWEHHADTDLLGTFSGEVERVGTALECARRKCEWGLEQLGEKAEYGLASEGSFGPHPYLPFLPSDQEILYFIDRRQGFHLHVTHLSEKTNYQMKAVESLEALETFAREARFPSHALIIRPNQWEDRSIIFKGVDCEDRLEEAFAVSRQRSADSKAWVETDMRAQCNPTRMAVIGELTEKLAERLATPCPACRAPGWGNVRVETGLLCKWCGSPTRMVKQQIFGCTLCAHEEASGRPDGLEQADPGQCQYCNP